MASSQSKRFKGWSPPLLRSYDLVQFIERDRRHCAALGKRGLDVALEPPLEVGLRVPHFRDAPASPARGRLRARRILSRFASHPGSAASRQSSPGLPRESARSAQTRQSTMGESTEGTPRQARNLALAVLPHVEENNQERRKDGHGRDKDGHVSMMLSPTTPAIGDNCGTARGNPPRERDAHKSRERPRRAPSR